MFLVQDGFSPTHVSILGLAFVAASVLLLVSVWRVELAIPKQEEISFQSGKVANVHPFDNAYVVRLVGVSEQFFYRIDDGARDDAIAEMVSAKNITIGYGIFAWWGDEKRERHILQIIASGKTIRTYSALRAAYRSNHVGLVIVAFFVGGIGVMTLASAYYTHRHRLK